MTPCEAQWPHVQAQWRCRLLQETEARSEPQTGPTLRQRGWCLNLKTFFLKKWFSFYLATECQTHQSLCSSSSDDLLPQTEVFPDTLGQRGVTTRARSLPARTPP